MPSTARHPTLTQSYYSRASLPNTSPIAAYLFRLIANKKTNLCVSADVTTSKELLELAEEVGDSICLFKTHCDIVTDFGHRTMERLQEVAKRKHFLIFEDRKFGDIGSTVQKQYTAGPLQIVKWAHIINAHIFPGPAIITALASAAAGAVAAYNSAVTTSISASPSQSYLDSSDEVPSPALSLRPSSDDLSSSNSPSEEDEEEEEDDIDETAPITSPVGGAPRHSSTSSTTDRYGRKPSVVSVSTTISTKTESISPAPAQSPHNDPSNPNSSDSEAGSVSSVAERQSALDRLGDPPYARSLLLLAQMSSAGNLFTDAYTAACIEYARQYPDFVMGFIAQRSLNTGEGDNFITMTPGVQIGSSGDGLGQQYNTPEKVVRELGTDVIIVGRGIIAKERGERGEAAEVYRERGWRAYEERVRGGK